MNPAYSPPSHRESFTQQVSLKIGISLEQKFMVLARQRNLHINHVFRDALVQYVAAPTVANDEVTVLTQRLGQLEVENAALRQHATPAVSPQQTAYQAFDNELVIAAIRDVAERVENADIEYTAEAILQQFTSFIPSVA